MRLGNIKLIAKKCFLYCLLALLPSCSFAPLYERPPLPTAETYPREECGQNGTNVRQMGWEDFFNDPALKQLILLALHNNRDLRTAIYRLEEAKALYRVQFGELLPVQATLTAVQARIPNICKKHDHFTHFSAYGAALSVISWEIDFWGRLRNLKDAELEKYLATAEAERATCITLIGQVANTYIIESELVELIRIAMNTIKTRQEGYRIMQLRFQEGAASRFDYFQAESLLSQAQADLSMLQRKRELNWNAMTLLVGIPICPAECLLSEIEPCFIEHICAGLPSELLCNRPDVLAAEHKLLAANANIGAARAAFFPIITLTGTGGIASTELRHLCNPGNFFGAFIPNLSIPIFEYRKNKSFLSLTQVRQNLALTEYERTIQVAFREVADALAERDWLSSQVLFQKELVEAQKERARLSWLRFQYSTGSFLEVLDAEREKFFAEQAFVQTRRFLLASGINLYIALGGGCCSR